MKEVSFSFILCLLVKIDSLRIEDQLIPVQP